MTNIKAPPVNVRLDERVRALGAALAGTDYLDRERKEGLGKAHAVAEQADLWVAPLRDHPCCTALQSLLDAGVTPGALFAYALGLSVTLRPERRSTALLKLPVAGLEGDMLATHLARFQADARLDALWEQSHGYWEQAVHDAGEALARTRVGEYLALWFDKHRQPVFIPHLLYPARTPLGIAARGEAICICPPPQAWGESKPWNYVDDVEWTRLVAFRECCRATLRGLPWPAEPDLKTVDLLATALTVLFLREDGDVAGARALQLMDTKRRGLKALPYAVEALESFTAARAAGQPVEIVPSLLAALAGAMQRTG